MHFALGGGLNSPGGVCGPCQSGLTATLGQEPA